MVHQEDLVQMASPDQQDGRVCKDHKVHLDLTVHPAALAELVLQVRISNIAAMLQ